MTDGRASVPEGRAAVQRWKALRRWDQVSLWSGRRSPDTREEAIAALGYARRMQRGGVFAWTVVVPGALAGFTVWLVLDMLVQGRPWTEAAIPATTFAVTWTLVGLTLGRRRARRLGERAEASLHRLDGPRDQP